MAILKNVIHWITPQRTDLLPRAPHPNPLDHFFENPEMYFRPPDIDVAALRKRMRMTQKQFCRRFGFSLGTLRHWERGDRRPRGTALMLLTIVRHNPRAVVAALNLEIRRSRWPPLILNPGYRARRRR